MADDPTSDDSRYLYMVTYVPAADVDSLLGSTDPVGALETMVSGMIPQSGHLTFAPFPTGIPTDMEDRQVSEIAVVVFNRLDSPILGGAITPNTAMIHAPYQGAPPLPKPVNHTDLTKDWIDHASPAQTGRVAVGIWTIKVLGAFDTADRSFTLELLTRVDDQDEGSKYVGGPTIEVTSSRSSAGVGAYWLTLSVSHSSTGDDPVSATTSVSAKHATEDWMDGEDDAMPSWPGQYLVGNDPISMADHLVGVRFFAYTWIFIDVQARPTPPAPPVEDDPPPPPPPPPTPPPIVIEPKPNLSNPYWTDPTRPPPFYEGPEGFGGLPNHRRGS